MDSYKLDIRIKETDFEVYDVIHFDGDDDIYGTFLGTVRRSDNGKDWTSDFSYDYHATLSDGVKATIDGTTKELQLIPY